MNVTTKHKCVGDDPYINAEHPWPCGWKRDAVYAVRRAYREVDDDNGRRTRFNFADVASAPFRVSTFPVCKMHARFWQRKSLDSSWDFGQFTEVYEYNEFLQKGGVFESIIVDDADKGLAEE